MRNTLSLVQTALGVGEGGRLRGEPQQRRLVVDGLEISQTFALTQSLIVITDRVLPPPATAALPHTHLDCRLTRCSAKITYSCFPADEHLIIKIMHVQHVCVDILYIAVPSLGCRGEVVVTLTSTGTLKHGRFAEPKIRRRPRVIFIYFIWGFFL